MTAPAPKPCPFCLWQPDERFIQLPRNWVEHTSVGDCVLKGMAFPIEQWNSRAHYSDCAVHNDPAYNNGECTCGRPQQSAEPVAWPCPECGGKGEVPVKGSALGPMTCVICGGTGEVAASPGPSELVERPNTETQVVAYRNPETGHVCSREKWESMGSSFRQGMRQPLYAASEVKENDD